METPPSTCCLGPAPYDGAELFSKEIALELISQSPLAYKPLARTAQPLTDIQYSDQMKLERLYSKSLNALSGELKNEAPWNQAILSTNRGLSLPGKVRRVL